MTIVVHTLQTTKLTASLYVTSVICNGVFCLLLSRYELLNGVTKCRSPEYEDLEVNCLLPVVRIPHTVKHSTLSMAEAPDVSGGAKYANFLSNVYVSFCETKLKSIL